MLLLTQIQLCCHIKQEALAVAFEIRDEWSLDEQTDALRELRTEIAQLKDAAPGKQTCSQTVDLLAAKLAVLVLTHAQEETSRPSCVPYAKAAVDQLRIFNMEVNSLSAIWHSMKTWQCRIEQNRLCTRNMQAIICIMPFECLLHTRST